VGWPTSYSSAIEDGAYSTSLKVRLEQLEAEKLTLENRLAETGAPPVFIHPKLSEVYREKVETLADALNDDAIRGEAAEVLRGLIDRVVLTPDAGALRIELYGDLAEILALSDHADQKTNRPGPEEPGRLSVVAGARINLYRTKKRVNS